MSKKQLTDEKIIAAYEAIEEADPDISTERLLAMTADTVAVPYERVVDALCRRAEKRDKDGA